VITLALAQSDVIQNPPASTSQNPADTLKLIDRLVEQNGQLEKQNKELIEQIQHLRDMLGQQTGQGSTPIPAVISKPQGWTERFPN